MARTTSSSVLRLATPAAARVLALAALVALATLSACGPSAPPPTGKDGGGQPKSTAGPGADTLVIATQADADSFVDFVSQSASDSDISSNMFRSLTTSNFDCRLEYLPDLAESWDRPDDGLSITYHLRRDQKWSDGQPITADDVAFTYDLVADPVVASPRISYVEHMTPDGRPRVLDPFTVRFEFTHAYDRQTQMSHTGLGIYPKHVLQKLDRASLRGSDFDKDPTVSGPWKLGKWDRGSTITLVPNPGYTGENPPTLKRVILKVVPEYATRLIELESGSVDMIESFQTVEDISRIEEARPDLKMYDRGKRFLDYVGWNLANPLFEDKEVRQALTLAIDREKLVHDLLTTKSGEVYGVQAVSWITPELCDVQSGDIQPFPYDPARAKEILAAHGWKDTNGDGILDKDGKPFRFELLTNSGNARRAKAVIIIQALLKNVGVDCQIASVESNNFFERMRKRDYEAALSGWSAGLFVDPIELWHSDTPDHRYEFNFTGYHNPEADALMEEGMRTADPDVANEIWKRLQAMIYDDQPYTYLFWRSEVLPLDARFQGAKVDILSYLRDLNEWWVPADRMKYGR